MSVKVFNNKKRTREVLKTTIKGNAVTPKHGCFSGLLLLKVLCWHGADVGCDERHATRPRDRGRTPSTPGWRGRMQWGRRCVRTSLFWPRGCATCRAARRRSGSPRSSRRSWCSPSRPGTRSRTPRPAPACAWRCSSGWPWPSAGGCPPWVSSFKRTERDTVQPSGGEEPNLSCMAPPSQLNVICTLDLPIGPFQCQNNSNWAVTTTCRCR